MPQHMDALARANKVRQVRAELKQQIRTGELTVADVLQDVPAEAKTMTVSDLLLAQKGWGLDRTNRLLRTVPVSPLKPVGQLTERQCKVIGYGVTLSPAELRMAA